jgi:hypothetical protein
LKKIWQIERNSYLCNPKRKQGTRSGGREERGRGEITQTIRFRGERKEVKKI